MGSVAQYGELQVVGALKCHDVRPGCVDPSRRFVGFRRGLTLVILDTAQDTPVEGAIFRDATSTYRMAAISPGGDRVAVRDRFEQTLEVRGAETVSARTPTTLKSWDGEILAPRTHPPRWGYAAETVAFTASGDAVLLATHDADGQACVQLYRAADLELLDTLTDLRMYSVYATDGDEPFVPMKTWSESYFVQDPLDPGLVLAVRNAGDSCMGVFAVRADGERAIQVDPAALSSAVFAVDQYRLNGLRLLPSGGLLVIDRDDHLARVGWPPVAGAPIEARRHVFDHITDDQHRVQIPWFKGDPDDLYASRLSITGDHLLINVDAGSGFTVGMVAFDPVSLEPLGLVKRPRDRLKFAELLHLGGDLFAGVGSATSRLWRLRR